ncbi:MAG: asparagine synthase (glutamine-hydrolyzing), partial [Candidatus Hodarchaeales archaeon]
MCGIFGCNFNDKSLLKKIGDVLKHRGPDGRGSFSDENVSLGHRRLKVIDLSDRAKQPISNENNSVWLVYNGEIYNFRGLRSELEGVGHDFKSETDSEVIVHGYEEWGTGVVDKLRGVFAFAIYDSDKKKLVLARDRIGVKPLYYYFDGARLVFASEIKAILEYIKPVLDKEALDEFFTFQYCIAPKTLFQGIRKVRAGCFLEIDLKTGQLKEKIYWDLISKASQKREDYFIQKIEEKIKESVKLRLISDVPLGIYLSGGLDSSYIAALAKELKEDIKAYTIGFNHPTDETEYAKLVAEHLDLDHKVISVEADEVELLPKVTWHLDTPVVNVASVPLYIMSRTSKKYLTVALMGDGGDELFAGYEKYRLLAIREKTKKLPGLITKPAVKFAPIEKENKKRLKKFLTKQNGEAYLSYISSFDDEEKKELYIGWTGVSHREALEKYFVPNRNVLQSAMIFDLKTLLPDDYLMKVDKSTMANAIEARVPYLDHQMAELALSIPPEYKLKNLKTKAIFRKVLIKKLPKPVVNRGK